MNEKNKTIKIFDGKEDISPALVINDGSEAMNIRHIIINEGNRLDCIFFKAIIDKYKPDNDNMPLTTSRIQFP